MRNARIPTASGALRATRIAPVALLLLFSVSCAQGRTGTEAPVADAVRSAVPRSEAGQDQLTGAAEATDATEATEATSSPMSSSEPTSDVTATPLQDAAAVLATFDGYRAAVIDRDGPAAVALLTIGAIDRYGVLQGVALDAPAEEVRRRPPLQRIIVGVLRAARSAADLAAMSPRDLAQAAVEEGWADFGALSAIAPTDSVEFSGDDAWMRVEVQMTGFAAVTVPLAFRWEGGGWRFDTATLDDLQRRAFAENAAGSEQDDVVAGIVSEIVGRPVTEATLLTPLRDA